MPLGGGRPLSLFYAMRQLDLFEFAKERLRTAPLLLLKGTNFLSLPTKRPILSNLEKIALVVLVLFILPSLSLKPDPLIQDAGKPLIREQSIVLGVATEAKSETLTIEVPVSNVPNDAVNNKEQPKPTIHKSKTPVSRLSVPILMYHHVGFISGSGSALDRSLTVSPHEFEEQILYLKQQGYQTVSLAAVYAALTTGGYLPNRAVVLTFDDGYKDVFENAVPILKKHGFMGTFAVSPALLEKEPYASWGEILRAYLEGMEIVSHSMNHIDLTNQKYSEEDLITELQGSKLFLESRLATSVDFFVYPYGKYNARALKIVEQAGYKMALTTEFGTIVNKNSLLTTPRVRVHGQNGLEKLKKVFEKKVVRN